MLKIATWNVNSLRVRLPQVLEWLNVHQPDVLALQEIKLTDELFPHEQFAEMGYQSICSGQKTYNGVALISRQPFSQVITDFPTLTDPQRRILGATLGNVRVLNLYVPNGQSVISEKYSYKLEWLTHLQQYVQIQLQEHNHLIILGDFNIAPQDEDVHDPAAWDGHVLVSEAEREALRKIMMFGVEDTFRLFSQPDKSFSWWDYRQAAFRRNMGLRIDLILASQTMAVKCQSCVIDKIPRSSSQPSDHTPVIAVFGE